MRNNYTALTSGVACLLFLLLAGKFLTSGDKFNIIFTIIVSLAVSMTSCYQLMTVPESGNYQDERNVCGPWPSMFPAIRPPFIVA